MFAVNRYECFMENKNKKTFCNCKISKKNHIEPHQNFTCCYKKQGGYVLTSGLTSKVKRDK